MSTRVSYISGIPANEFPDRGKEVRPVAYIPYLSLTQGEMKLALMQRQAATLAKFYPELPEYRAAEKMLANALAAGVHNGIKWIGRVDDSLNAVARQIMIAENETAPASSALFARAAINSGIGDVIPVSARMQACLQAAGGNVQRIMKCYSAFEIEKILNSGLENAAHHTLYFKFRDNYTYPNRVEIKRLDHQKGIGGLAVVGDLPTSLMETWVNTAILQKNTTGGVGAVYADRAGFLLSPNPDQDWTRYQAGQPYVPPKPKLGIDPVTVTALATLVAAALGGAVSLLEQMRKNKAYAMAEARGYGTPAFSAGQSDWLAGDQTAPGQNNNTLLLLGAAAVAAVLMSEEN